MTGSLTNQLDELELGWRYNPLEHRNAHGEWSRDGSIAGKALSGMRWGEGARYKSPPADRVAMGGAKASDNGFIKKYGLNAKNIVAAYDAATPDERDQGMRWYSDAHDIARFLGQGDAEKGAALLSTFSVQTDWATDVMNTAHTLASGKVPEHGVGITGSVRARAEQILGAKSSEDIEKLFPPAGSSKTRNFFHLIRNGGDTPGDEDGAVVIDRHALSVAAGRRLTRSEVEAPTYAEIKADHPDWSDAQSKEYKASFPPDPTGAIFTYEHISDMYRQAAKEVSERDGIQISPHQMQAITWMHQLGSNDREDARLAELGAEAVRSGGKMSQVQGAMGAKGRAASMKKKWAAWASYAQAHQVPVHVGTTVMATNPALAEYLDLARWDGWREEPRDSHGRWTRFGGVGAAVRVMEKEREGFSVSPRTGESPHGGYMVALDGHTHRYPAEILDDPDKLKRAIDDMLMSERESFQGRDMYLGGWVEDGKLWLDPSQNVQDRAEAERLGKERDQVGIFDLQSFDTINTGGSGGGRIIDHANAREGAREGAGRLLGPSGGGAPGRRGAPGGADPGGPEGIFLGGQLAGIGLAVTVSPDAMTEPGMPVPDDPDAIAMFTAHRVNGIARYLGRAVERLGAARKATGELRLYHSHRVARHTADALDAAHWLSENVRAHYPAEAAELKRLEDAIGLAKPAYPQAGKATFAHLLQTILYQLGHTVMHSSALTEDHGDEGWEFDADHAGNHLDGATEHVKKLAEHLRDNYPREARFLKTLEDSETLLSAQLEDDG